MFIKKTFCLLATGFLNYIIPVIFTLHYCELNKC